MKTYKITFIAIAISVLTSCNDFLDESPSKTSSVVPETIEQLESLLNSYSNFAEEGANEVIFGTDDYGLLMELYDAKSSLYSVPLVQYATWDKEDVANYDRPYWPTEWRKIFTANLILANLPKVSGSEDEKQKIEAEAHFIRAYSYFKLANIFNRQFFNVGSVRERGSCAVSICGAGGWFVGFAR